MERLHAGLSIFVSRPPLRSRAASRLDHTAFDAFAKALRHPSKALCLCAKVPEVSNMTDGKNPDEPQEQGNAEVSNAKAVLYQTLFTMPHLTINTENQAAACESIRKAYIHFALHAPCTIFVGHEFEICKTKYHEQRINHEPQQGGGLPRKT